MAAASAGTAAHDVCLRHVDALARCAAAAAAVAVVGVVVVVGVVSGGAAGCSDPSSSVAQIDGCKLMAVESWPQP